MGAWQETRDPEAQEVVSSSCCYSEHFALITDLMDMYITTSLYRCMQDVCKVIAVDESQREGLEDLCVNLQRLFTEDNLLATRRPLLPLPDGKPLRPVKHAMRDVLSVAEVRELEKTWPSTMSTVFELLYSRGKQVLLPGQRVAKPKVLELQPLLDTPIAEQVEQHSPDLPAEAATPQAE